MGRIFVALFLPATTASRIAEDRTLTRTTLGRIAVALETHRKTHGKFPAKLADLKPRFLSQVPKDLYTGRPLIYRRTATGYLLYSVGADQKDDKGRSFDATPPGNDIVVRVRLK